MRCSSSPFGSGLARRKRLKASKTSAGVQGFGLEDFLGWEDFGWEDFGLRAAFDVRRAAVPDVALEGIVFFAMIPV